MPLVREDDDGLYVIVGGWIARPLTEETTHPRALGLHRPGTRFTVGDRPNASHSGGPIARVGGEPWFIDRAAGTPPPVIRPQDRPRRRTTRAVAPHAEQQRITVILRWTETHEHRAMVNVPPGFEPGNEHRLSDAVAELTIDTHYAGPDRDGFRIEKVLPSVNPHAKDLRLDE
ncbi:hypothetical protein ACFYTQ_28145 [Nocardia sp. NPDC004068]|uniref:hypothetical protein n=1 Tax=Nocardia sp. NPDC004068 TaxID=3364303 RepID=UPI0036B6CA12